MTRWKAAVGTASDPSTSVIRVERSSSMNSVSIRRSSVRSTLQARMTRTASGSSVSASRRCSSVASSWRWRLASDKAEWIACSRVVEKDGTALLLSVDWRSGSTDAAHLTGVGDENAYTLVNASDGLSISSIIQRRCRSR